VIQPVTIADLRQARVLLEVGYTKCGHHAYYDPRDLPFLMHRPFRLTSNTLVCSKCGARGSYTRPDERSGVTGQGVTGQYAKY
jgi:hypothetical protein